MRQAKGLEGRCSGLAVPLWLAALLGAAANAHSGTPFEASCSAGGASGRGLWGRRSESPQWAWELRGGPTLAINPLKGLDLTEGQTFGFPSAGLGFPSVPLGFPSVPLGIPSAQLGIPSAQLGIPSVRIGNRSLRGKEAARLGIARWSYRFALLKRATEGSLRSTNCGAGEIALWLAATQQA